MMTERKYVPRKFYNGIPIDHETTITYHYTHSRKRLMDGEINIIRLEMKT